MKELLLKLEEWNENIKFDIAQDWNDNKLQDTLDVTKLEMAICLLNEVRNINNIPNNEKI